MCSPVVYRHQKKNTHMLPNFFSHIDKHGRTQSVFWPRLRKIIESCRTDAAISAGSSYWPVLEIQLILGPWNSYIPASIFQTFTVLWEFMCIRSQFCFTEFLFRGKEILNSCQHSYMWCCSTSQTKFTTRAKCLLLHLCIWAWKTTNVSSEDCVKVSRKRNLILYGKRERQMENSHCHPETQSLFCLQESKLLS